MNSLTHICQIVKITSIGIVGLAIPPNETNILGAFMYRFVFAFGDFLFDKTKIHWLFDDLGIVEET